MATAFGRYELIQKIAEGGMAEVFLAVQRGPGGFEKRVALKQILPHLALEDEFVKMFLDEARIAASLSHPNICQIFDLGEERGRLYLAMEYLAGPSLAQLVLKASRDRAPLPPLLGAFVLARAAEGLAYAHEKKSSSGEPLGIVHRDISPQNIVVTREGQVKLVDFGIARAEDRLVQTQAGHIRGNVFYMSPEQVTGKRVDHRSDVFSLGIVLHELIASRPLFREDHHMGTMEKIVRGSIPRLPRHPGVPEAINDVALAALERSLEARLPSAREFSRRLDDALRTAQPVPSSQTLAEYVRAQFPELPDEDRSPRRWSTQARELPDEPARNTRPLSPPFRELSPGARNRKPWVMLGGVVLGALGVGAAYALSQRRTIGPPPRLERIEPRATAPQPPASSPAPAFVGASAATGRLSLETSPPADIYLQGQRLGRTPLTEVVLPIGRHRLRAINLDANVDRIIEIEIDPGQTTAQKVAW